MTQKYRTCKYYGQKSATEKPGSPEEMSAIQSFLKMNIKSYVVLGKKHGGRCTKKLSSVAKPNLDFNSKLKCTV